MTRGKAAKNEKKTKKSRFFHYFPLFASMIELFTASIDAQTASGGNASGAP
jgi:hypothetical protein